MNNYFSFSELRVTNTGLPNYVDDFEVHLNLLKLRTVLNVLRGLLGSPIVVNSAFRSPKVNEAVGGSKTSYHLYGRAADITCDDSTAFASLYEYCVRFHDCGIFEECILYPDKNFIHVAI